MVKEDRSRPVPGLADWERKLASIVARKFELFEPEELEAELFLTVIKLKARLPPGIQKWEHYLAKALHNRADDWARDRRAGAKKESALPEQDKETAPFFSSKEYDIDQQLAMSQFWQELDPELKQLWELLEQEKWNQTRVARLLGKHRNTVRSWIHKIRRVLTSHGFKPGADSDKRIVRKPALQQPDEFVVLSQRLLRTLAATRLRGTAWRVLLWVLRETSRRKQTTTPFSWYRIAGELGLDRGDVSRAGHRLLRTGLVFIQGEKIGLQRKHRRARPRKD